MVALLENTDNFSKTAHRARGATTSTHAPVNLRSNSLNRIEFRAYTYVDRRRLGSCSKDPIGYEAGSNCLYEYCHSEPLKYIDPWGKQIMPPTGPSVNFPPESWPEPHPPSDEDTGTWVTIYVGMACTPVDETVAIVWVCGKAVRVVKTVLKCVPKIKRVRVRKDVPDPDYDPTKDPEHIFGPDRGGRRGGPEPGDPGDTGPYDGPWNDPEHIFSPDLPDLPRFFPPGGSSTGSF